jgi:shikimate kinase
LIHTAANNVILVGPPGSGKTSTGQLLAERLGWAFADTDRLIEQRVGSSVSEIFANRGELHFRALETELLSDLAGDTTSHSVLATGGGIIITPGNFDLMEKIGIVVGLLARLETLMERLQSDRTRPLLAGVQAQGETVNSAQEQLQTKLGNLLESRANHYALPSHTVKTDGLTPDEVADAVYRLICNAK